MQIYSLVPAPAQYIVFSPGGIVVGIGGPPLKEPK